MKTMARAWIVASSALVGGLAGCNLQDFAFEQGFRLTCAPECVKSGGDKETCDKFCSCSIDYFKSSGKMARVRELGEGVANSPEMAETMGVCGGDLFSAACNRECANAKVDAATCTGYCSCAFELARDQKRMAELMAMDSQSGPGVPALRVDMVAACGSDFYDQQFVNAYKSECGTTAECDASAKCHLNALRGDRSREEGTRFMMVNIEADPITPAGQTAIEAAQATCLGGA